MGLGGLFNKYKYLVAAVGGLAMGAAYFCISLQQTENPDHNGTGIAVVTVGTFGAIICLILIFEICSHAPADLGKLQEERSSLIVGLMFTFVLGGWSVFQYFAALAAPPRGADFPAWIYGSWGEAGDCSTPLIISRGASEGELVFRIGSASDVRRIVRPPTSSAVQTDQGTYRRQLDGSMVTTEQGMENIRLTPCGQ